MSIVLDINIETKKPSTVNFMILSMLRLRTVRRITPGIINKDGRTSMALNSDGAFIKHEVKKTSSTIINNDKINLLSFRILILPSINMRISLNFMCSKSLWFLKCTSVCERAPS